MILEKKFDKLSKDIIEFNAETKNYSTFGIGGKVYAVIKPRTKQELIDAVCICKKNNFKFQVIGNGSNILFNSNNMRRVIITTKFIQDEIIVMGQIVKVSSGVLIGKLISYVSELGLSGLEELYGIPATVGGMVMTNAGAFGKQILDYVENIEVLEGGKVKQLNKSDVEYAYHYTNLLKSNKIILSILFKLERLASSVIKSKCREVVIKRNESQPKGKSAGCVFRKTRNNMPAGLLIDKAGLKGYKIKDALISEKHANFIINVNNATDKDVKDLIRTIRKEIKDKFNITLKREIEYIGDRDDYYR